ncbi:MAG: cation diffusion facilitator family transporter [Candidatus Kaiserbacteria bacterium]|nr:cation diffusion facilitator family transporter [Candidatus Kaiserbacteria bacterium]
MSQPKGSVPVALALLGNIVVTIIKAIVAAFSGSSAMFSEAVHSFADTLNQSLLLIGVWRSRKKPEGEFNYGYGSERFFWAVISACGIFFVGAGITIWRGLHALLYPESVAIDFYAFLVLFVSFVIEFWTFRVATRELVRAYPDLSWWDRLDRADPSTLAVCLEDGIAVIGVLIASIAIAFSYVTQNTMWDAAGSILIGILLAVAAVILIMKNRVYLIGRAIPEWEKEAILEILKKEPSIERVIDFKSTVIGIGEHRIKCEVEFNGSSLLDEQYQQEGLRSQFDEIRNDYEEFKKFCVEYADRIPRLMGKKIDEIEEKIREAYPSIRHIDIEIN